MSDETVKLKAGQAIVGFNAADVLDPNKTNLDTSIALSTGQLDLDKDEDRTKAHDANLAIASNKDPKNPILKLFVNETGIANFGHGSLASKLGIDIHDLDGNVFKPSDTMKEAAPLPDIPAIRYINQDFGVIELKLYASGLIHASKTLDNKRFELVIATKDPREVLLAIAERSYRAKVDITEVGHWPKGRVLAEMLEDINKTQGSDNEALPQEKEDDQK